MPVSDAKIFEPNILYESYNLQLSGIGALDWFDKISITAKSKKHRMQFSKCTIKRVKRVGGNFKVISRGRTSLNSASFSFRATMPNLYNKLCECIPLYATSPQYVHAFNIQPVDDTESGYNIDLVSLDNFIQFGVIERAMDSNTRSLSGRRNNEKLFMAVLSHLKC